MLTFESVSKSFGDKKAVVDLQLEVRPGQVMGFLGPNGAGKSTSMKMAAGFLRPTSGRITLDGIDVWKRPIAAKKVLGYLPERAPLYEDFSVTEYLSYMAKLKRLSGSALRNSVDSVIDSCFLQPVKHQLATTLSKGYRHRLCLAQSLLGDPKILIFDEPTDGLDPNQKQEIRLLINRIKEGRAIIISTHILEEVEAVCTDVFIIAQGEKVFAGKPDDLRRLSKKPDQLTIRTTTTDLVSLTQSLRTIPEVVSVTTAEEGGNDVSVTLFLSQPSDSEIFASILKAIQDTGSDITYFSADDGRIGDSFRSLTLSPASTLAS